ncbi:MAG: cation diffusion facilitator family transporter [Caulobacteraceae bacterium]
MSTVEAGATRTLILQLLEDACFRDKIHSTSHMRRAVARTPSFHDDDDGDHDHAGGQSPGRDHSSHDPSERTHDDGAASHAGHTHSKGESHAGHSHAAPPNDWRYAVGIGLNTAFVVIEAGYGLWANSTALLADAGHNLSDVLGLALAGGAAWLAKRQSAAHRTYGFGKATILAALGNALLLVFACGAIVWEAIDRFGHPEPVQFGVVMIVAAVGVLVNGATALLFMAGRKSDVNVRGAFLHMASDAAVSVGVIIAGGAIALTGLTWIDPVTSLLIVAVIMVGTWGLLKESMDLAIDAAPAGFELDELRTYLLTQPGVADVHDLHVWNFSTTETAVTAHIVHPGGPDPTFLSGILKRLRERFGVEHATLQVEAAAQPNCPRH